MIDYDIPFLENDIKDLEKKALLHKDKEGNIYMRYKEILDSAKPKKI